MHKTKAIRRFRTKDHASRMSGGRKPSSITLFASLVLAALVGMGLLAFFSGELQIRTPDDLNVGALQGSSRGVGADTWSYYHNEKIDTSNSGPKWSTDRTRSTDPNEAVLGNTSRWDYDGAYEYGPYGSDGMNRRSAGKESSDPLYSQPIELPDVFTEYNSLDPSGGQPIGVLPSSMTNPYFDPYAGYSNPYANQVRLAYGEGYGAGALAQG